MMGRWRRGWWGGDYLAFVHATLEMHLYNIGSSLFLYMEGVNRATPVPSRTMPAERSIGRATLVSTSSPKTTLAAMAPSLPTPL